MLRQFASRRLLFCYGAVFLFFCGKHVFADDIVVNTTVSGPQTLNGLDRLVITEAGKVAASAGNPGVLSSNPRNEIVNLGAIRTAGDDAYAIFNNSSHRSLIANGGSIFTSGSSAHGIYIFFSNGASATNSGLIRVTGEDARGIYIFTPSRNFTLTNTGAIISERSAAIRMSSNGGVLNIAAPAYLGGAIDFAGTAQTVTIETGASHSVLWHLPVSLAGGAPAVFGSVPWFYDPATGRFATFEPTGLSASFNQLASNANTLARLGRYGLRQAGRLAPASAISATLAYGDGGTEASKGFDMLLATNSGPDAAYGFRSGHFWITGFGGTANHDGDGSTLDQTIDQIGAAAGYAWNQSPLMRLGVMAGYMNGTITAKSTWADSQDIDSNGVFAGIYGDRRFGRVTVGLGVAGGWQTNDSSRFINDNTALTGGLTLGESWASASYDSWFITPEASLSAVIELGNTGLVVTPTVRARYAMQHTSAYEESGSNANASVDAHSLGVVEGDFELAVSKDIGAATLTGRAGYLVRSSAGDDDVTVMLLGITNSVGLDATDRSAAYAGVSLDLHLGPSASFTLDGQGTFSGDVDALQGMARLAIRF